MTGSPGDPFPSTPEEIAAALRRDPILLSELMGNGHTAEVDAALHAKLEQAAYPVFVVLTRTPPGMEPRAADEDLATLVHAALGRDGVYLVQTSRGYGQLSVYGDVVADVPNEGDLIALARYTGLDQVRAALEERWGDEMAPSPATEAGILLDVAASASIPDYDQPVLDDAQVAAYTEPAWRTIGYVSRSDSYDPDGPVTVGLGALIGVSVGLVVAAVAFRLLRAVSATPWRALATAAPGHTTRTARTAPEQRAPAPAPVDHRADAEGAVTALRDALERATGRDAARLELATGSLETARDLLDRADATDLDLVGAAVLARIGSHALSVSTVEPYRCCFVDPDHGRGNHRADLPGGLRVPVCRPCERALEAGREPHALTERHRGRRRPYYAGDSVWARTGYGALTDELWVAVRADLEGRDDG